MATCISVCAGVTTPLPGGTNLPTNFTIEWPFQAGVFVRTASLYGAAGGSFAHTRLNETGYTNQYYALDLIVFNGPTEGEPVLAVADGVVVQRGNCSDIACGYGHRVVVEHSDGVRSLYAHLSAFVPGVDVGDTVCSGQVIGYAGDTGMSTEPHLHLALTTDAVLFSGLYISGSSTVPEPIGGAQDLIKDGLYMSRSRIRWECNTPPPPPPPPSPLPPPGTPCSGVVYTSATSGTISIPNPYTGVPGSYQSNLDCVWRWTLPPEAVVSFVVNQLSIDGFVDFIDFITPGLGAYTYTGSRVTVPSVSGDGSVRFKSGSNTNGTGVVLTWSVSNLPSPPPSPPPLVCPFGSYLASSDATACTTGQVADLSWAPSGIGPIDLTLGPGEETYFARLAVDSSSTDQDVTIALAPVPASPASTASFSIQVGYTEEGDDVVGAGGGAGVRAYSVVSDAPSRPTYYLTLSADQASTPASFSIVAGVVTNASPSSPPTSPSSDSGGFSFVFVGAGAAVVVALIVVAAIVVFVIIRRRRGSSPPKPAGGDDGLSLTTLA